MARQGFTLYTKKLDGGDIINLNRKFIDDKGSYEQISTVIYDLFDKKPEDSNKNLVGQNVWNNQSIRKLPIDTDSTIAAMTFYLENGSIKVEYNTFNWNLEPIVATIIFGTGKYLGAQGYVTIVVKEVQPDSCVGFNYKYLFTTEYTFTFTN